MSPDYENSWLTLNGRLRQLERVSGLGAALRELECHHLNNGFLTDTLWQVESRSFSDPDHPERFFRAQYNPRRAHRFRGAGRTLAADLPAHGCFLCRDTIELQQQGAQLGYRIESGKRVFFALTNPFPVLPGHIVVASEEHRTQEWGFRDPSGVAVEELVEDLVLLSARMPEYVGFYNGIGGGCSIPEHLHYQFVTRPGGVAAFPLELAARSGRGKNADASMLIRHYPVEAVVWTGSTDLVVTCASDWLTAWARRNGTRLDDLSANFVATGDGCGDRVSLYFVPRRRSQSRLRGVGGVAGALEVLGEVVLADPDAGTRLRDGSINYFSLQSALESLHIPLEPA
ncbi:MAG: DUF4922 domain-containing protein [Alphaproteobacteria bacterium]|nr:DUF4922 domain-containing protein [Alphaproteobacteria bacterium]